MKKLSVFLSISVILMLMVFTFNKNLQESFTILSTFGIFLLLFFSYFYFEKSMLGTKEIAIIATLSAFIAVSRMVFAPLPNVKPVTFLVALSGYVFGPFEGFIIGSSSAFISNIFFGQGPWTPWQMFSWGLIGAISGFWGKKNSDVSALKFSIVCFFYGFMFDWIMNLWFVLGFVKPITFESVAFAYVSGLTFDILHGGGSFIFSIIFYDSFLKVLNRYKKRLEITYLK
ncbi:energy-coupling factor transport system substrate-specific component [Clostridium amylolyticum]|uniref:Energy-coupling factor transport system substrate-specific component n=1 Tax=Clostridium amylolyticum TaxID=1121298 RepID=A0A1M6NQT7_9CLOT|nr:ECF transporter S component [Clostridium amylolyticum]SHJ98079.1 energy-coupling factor transport system substrate-specific component [Clostridium amylolyticum]